MTFKNKITRVVGIIISKFRNEVEHKNREYIRRYKKYSFDGDICIDEKQYEAVITRWYHTIEKGLAYNDFRAGFGEKNLDALLTAMENYLADGYSDTAFFYRTALSTLKAYQEKNKKYNYINEELNQRIGKLPGTPNDAGGVITDVLISKEEVQGLNYAAFVLSRHSMRHFSDEKIDIGQMNRVMDLAQHTPSACNRQGWQARIILKQNLIENVLKYQNGNQGFGNEFKGLILVTGDLRCFNKDRELYQVYIDGGMYCQSILNALHFENIASVPLSASLTSNQEKMIRKILSINDSEVLLMFIGIGRYPQIGLTTRSERKEASPIYYE